MTSITDQLKVLLDDTAFRALELLAGASSPVSGRALARSLMVSPTTASAALAVLKRAGFVASVGVGRANTWYLDGKNPTIRSWLEETRGAASAGDPAGRPQLTAVIFAALQLEYAAIVAHLPERRSARIATTRFEVGAFAGDRAEWNVYVAEIGAGNASTAIEVTSAAALRPHLVVFVGVAGSVKTEDLCQGDVVAAERVYNIHAGKDAWSEQEGSVHRTRPLSYPAAHGAIQLARWVRRTDWISELAAASSAADALNAKGKSPRVEIRPIAAGEVVHGDDRSQLMSKVRNDLNDAAAVDMESFGLYEAAHVRDLPALAVRGISDCVGDKQPDIDAEWQPRAASHAAAFAFALLRNAEPEDFQGTAVQVPPPESPPDGGGLPPREMLFLLPPPVAVAYEWALPLVGERATAALGEFVALGGQPATWLSRFRHRPPALFKGDNTGPLWVLAAEFADSHQHPTAPWLYEHAADRFGDGILCAYLHSCAAVAAIRDLGPGQAEELLARAETEAPAGHLVWDYHRAALRSDARAVLAATPSLARALDLGFSQPVLEAIGIADADAVQDDELAAFVDEFAERHPALLEQARLTVALTAASALQVTCQLTAAQMLLEGLAGGLSAYGGGRPGVSALGSLVGSRSSTVLLQIARCLCMRVANPSSRETGFDRDAVLARAEELAMTARDRRLDWAGPTGEALAVAAQARAATGDVRGALRLLLPPPLGTAAAAEAASQHAIRVGAELAVGTGNVELALELTAKIHDPVERRLATALALTLRSDSHPEAAAEYRSALAEPTMSARVDQQIRALLGLSMVAELSSEEFTRLEGIDPEIADLIRAQSFLTAGRTSEAQILARRYPDSDAALQIRVEGLVNQGKVADAISALETHAARHEDERFLVQAAVIALSSGLTNEASGLAARIASSVDPGRRRVGREILIDAASRKEEWEAVLGETRRLLDDDAVAEADPDRDASVMKYRWARAHAFHQLRRMEEAYEVIRAEPRLVPADLGKARLIVSILRTIAPSVKEASHSEADARSGVTQAEVLSVVSETAQAFPEDEELVATAVMTAFSMPTAEPPDPLLMTKARRLQQQYFESFPDSKLIRAVPIDDALTGVKEMLHTQLAPNAEIAEQMRRGAMVGQIPISVVTSMLQRSYAEVLVSNAVGSYVIRNSDDRVTAEETEAAKRALDGTVVIDTSALFLAPVVLGGATELKARFERLLVAAPQRDDILAARSSLMMRAVGSLGWDPISDRPTIVHYDEKLTERWASESERLAAALELCEIVGDPPHDGDPRNRAWSSPIRLARERGASLVADDAALRAAARSEGVAAFGSLQLLSALVADGLLPTDALEDSYRRLMEIRAAELPVFERLLDIAEEEGWKPTGYAAFLLTRPSTWIPVIGGWQTYTRLIRALPDKAPNEVAGWCTSALFGLSLITPPQTVPAAAGALVVWTMLELQDTGALPVLLTNAEHIVGQFVRGADLLKEVVQRLVTTIRQVTPPELVASVVLPMLAGLDAEAHTQAVGYFLTMP